MYSCTMLMSAERNMDVCDGAMVEALEPYARFIEM